MSFLNDEVHLVARWRDLAGVDESHISEEKPESEEKACGAEDVVEASVWGYWHSSPSHSPSLLLDVPSSIYDMCFRVIGNGEYCDVCGEGGTITDISESRSAKASISDHTDPAAPCTERDFLRESTKGDWKHENNFFPLLL